MSFVGSHFGDVVGDVIGAERPWKMMLAAASSRSALVATHVSRTVRALSNAAARPAFDGEQAALYRE